MDSLETELARAHALSVTELADAIEQIGFECTRCGACCKAADCASDAEDDNAASVDGHEEHTATVFPAEVRRLQERGDYDWRDVARPTPFGLAADGSGETFEWALQTDGCGDCTFYDAGACTVYEDRPLICQTYPFSVALDGTSQPLGEAVEREGAVRAHECEGLGREISRARAEELATALRERAVRELEEAVGVRDAYVPVDADADETVVYDSEGPKRPDGTPYGRER